MPLMSLNALVVSTGTLAYCNNKESEKTKVVSFPDPVLKRLYYLTGGVPRLINVICDRALTGAFV